MQKSTGLRQKAKLLRRIASVPTWGGHHADRELLALADKLDHEAASGSAKLRSIAKLRRQRCLPRPFPGIASGR
jgi:hypothetical protein